MFGLTIVYDGKTYTVSRVPFSDLVALERHFDLAAAAMGTGLRLEHLAFLAWRSLRRLGHIPPNAAFDEAFTDKIDDLTPEVEEPPLASSTPALRPA
jgi:hypothetical protein